MQIISAHYCIFSVQYIYLQQTFIGMRTFIGNNKEYVPIIKRQISDAWLCQLASGTIRIQLDFEEYELVSRQGNMVFFIVHDGQIFRILECSDDCELHIFTVSHETLITLYPHLGSEANARLNSVKFVTSVNMSPEFSQMLSLDFQQLRLMERSVSLMDRDKMYIHLLIHLYLTFCNGIGKVGSKNGTQSFNIMNCFYELFSEKESFCHRDTKFFADRLNITVRYLFQICKDEAGKSPKELINETIISEITHTMLTTKLSLQQISLKFNFPDQTAFTQFFKRNTGMTPSQFKQKYK